MMRILRNASAALLLLTSGALAQPYPTNNPTYTPTPRLTQAVAAIGSYVFNAQGLGVVSMRTTGTHTGLAGTVQCTNDGTNWTTLQMIPVGGGAAVSSFGNTNGFWVAVAAGCTQVRANVTVLTTGSASISWAGGQSAGAAYLVNPNTLANPTAIVDQTAAFYWGVDSAGIGPVKLTATTAGGGTPSHLLSAATTNSTSVKGSAGMIFFLGGVNTNAATAFAKLYDKATAPTCNSDAVLMTVPFVQNIPVLISIPVGVAFPTGIGLCITGAAADNDNTAATTGVTLSLVTK